MQVAVFDVNVLVSGFIVEGKPQKLWYKTKTNQIRLICSEPIASEFATVMGRKKFQKYVGEDDLRLFLEDLHRIAVFVKVYSRFKAVKDDPSDDAILRTAVDGKADFVVSGDKHLLSMGTFRGVRIVTVQEMLNILG